MDRLRQSHVHGGQGAGRDHQPAGGIAVLPLAGPPGGERPRPPLSRRRLPDPGRRAQAHPLAVRAGPARPLLLAKSLAALLRLVPLEPQLSLPVRRPPPVERPRPARAGPFLALLPARPGDRAGVPDPRLLPADRGRLAPALVAPPLPDPLAGRHPRRAGGGGPPDPLGDRRDEPSRPGHRGQKGVPGTGAAPGLPPRPRAPLLAALRFALGDQGHGGLQFLGLPALGPLAGPGPDALGESARFDGPDRPAGERPALAATATLAGLARPGYDRPLVAQGVRPGLLRGGGDRLLPLADHGHDVAGADPLPGGHPAGGALGGRARPLPACRP